MKVVLFVVCLVCLVACFVRVNRKIRQRALTKAFACRDELTDRQFFETYFRDKGVPETVSSAVRHILAKQFGEDMSRLAAGDDFTTNLKFLFDADSLADVEIITALEAEFQIHIPDAEARNLRTIEDIVLAVSNKMN